jgi:hypothetical protein
VKIRRRFFSVAAAVWAASWMDYLPSLVNLARPTGARLQKSEQFSLFFTMGQSMSYPLF